MTDRWKSAYAEASRWGLGHHARLHAADVLYRFPDARITSGYRTVAKNRQVGGVIGSFHTRRRAADFVVPAQLKRALLVYLRGQRVTEGCTGPEEVLDEGDHIHVAW